MEQYKPLIVGDVQRSIGAVNEIVVSLQRDKPLSSDIVDVNYPQSTVDQFLKSSKAVVDALHAASEKASTWLKETGDRLSRNLVETNGVQTAIRETSTHLRRTNEYINATQSRINTLQADIGNAQGNLSSAQNELSNARNKLSRERRRRDTVRVGAVASLFFAPVVSVALLAVDLTALQSAVDSRKNTVHTIESQLSASRAQLEAQHAQLTRERNESSQLSTQITQLNQRATGLAADARRLETARGELAELSKRINDCLHTVNAALSSSKTIASMSSMRNVVTGIRGVAGALKADAMFQGPLAQLDDTALGALDRRVANIRRLQIAV